MAAPPDSSNTTVPVVHDVIIIGAGPAGLAVAARLCEHTPSALFTDDEHQRYNWIRRHDQKMSIKNHKNGAVKKAHAPCTAGKYSTLVLDSSSDDWMSRWNRLFKTFDIKHLRSPMFFHVDPGDRDGLLAYTYEHGREKDLVEIRSCVGKEMSKHQKKKKRGSTTGNAHTRVIIEERDRKDYFTPSRSIFDDHCQCTINRYNLRSNLVQRATVEDITYGPIPSLSTHPLFTIRTSTSTHYTRVAILSVGPANPPIIPGLPTPLPHTTHSMQITTFPSPSLRAKIASGAPTAILIIGGGLTSAQLTDLALRRGVSTVHHLLRGPLKTKPFDIDLAWMGKYRNLSTAYFHGAESDAERLAQLLAARGGGSVTPGYARILERHVASGRLGLHTHTTLDTSSLAACWDRETKTYRGVRTTPPIEGLPPLDHVYFCTGIATDVTRVECLASMQRDYPIESCGGLPCLTEDLAWRDGVPLFVTGKMAGLRVGPSAANLGGARVGAERVVWGVEEVLARQREEEGGVAERRDSGAEMDAFATGRGNRFGSLGEE